MDNYHIAKDSEKWKLTKEGSNRAVITAGTKQEIIAMMQHYMKHKEGSVKIHKEDGKFQEERTYPRSRDPKKSKG